MNNEELMSRLIALQNGDRTVFEEIYKGLQTPIYTVIFRITRDKSVAEDILQEVFVKLFVSLPKSPIKNPRAYIFQMARNLAIDGMRKQLQFVSLDDIENTVYLQVDDVTHKLDVENAMKTLPLNECQIVTLHINGELTFREISEIMSIPLGTVLWKYQKAIGKLRSIISGGVL